MKVIYIFGAKIIAQQEGRSGLSIPLPGERVFFDTVEGSFIVGYRDWSFAPSDGFSYPTIITIYLMKTGE